MQATAEDSYVKLTWSPDECQDCEYVVEVFKDKEKIKDFETRACIAIFEDLKPSCDYLFEVSVWDLYEDRCSAQDKIEQTARKWTFSRARSRRCRVLTYNIL